MPSIAERLQPFFGQHCTLTLTDAQASFLKSLQIPTRKLRLPMFVFDWDGVSADLKGQICEDAGQDDFPIFAVLNADPDEEDFEAIVSSGSGFLLYSGDTIYIASGEMETFVKDAGEFVAKLVARDEDESDDEESDSGDDEESEGDEESEDDAKQAASNDDAEPQWLKITRETNWNGISKEERADKVRAIAQGMAWRRYDWKSSPSADLSFPDFTPEEMANKAPWMPKHHNDVADMETCHVPDLNQLGDGDERKMFATYGVPVAWPSRDKEPEQLNEMLDLLDAARKEGGEAWADAMGNHGLLDDAHYLWLRHYKLGWPKQLSGASDAIEKKLREIDEAVAAGDGARAFREVGLRDQAHLDAYKAYFAKVKSKAWSAHNEKAKEISAKLDAQHEKNKSELQGELAPVEGISLEDWAKSNAKIIQGTPLGAILAGLKIEQAAWDAANKEWNARMARDKTFTVVTIYGAAFMGDAAFAAAVAKARGQ